jgi:hypothetical protein
MINIRQLTSIELADLIEHRCCLRPSSQLFASIDVIRVFLHFKSFRLMDVKYEFLEYYQEHTLKRSVRILTDCGILKRTQGGYEVNTFIS